MAAGKSSFYNLIHFVTQTTEAGTKSVIEAPNTSGSYSGENGQEIKKFYETLVNDNFPRTKNVGVSNSVGKEVTRNSKNNDESKTKKMKSLLEIVQDDFDKTKLRRTREAVCTRTSEANSNTINTESRKPSTLEPFHRQKQDFKLLQAAQIGDQDQVSESLKKGVDINCQDFYGWTPLMCAAKEGHEEMVMYLLQCGSDHAIQNMECQTASSLARISGNDNIVKLISSFSRNKTILDENEKHIPKPSYTSVVETDGKVNTSSTYFCNICKSEFSKTEKKAHETSTVHLFNKGHKSKGPSYLIPETNKGFQMLLRTGWEKDKGLGPLGEGPKYPVKTVLKHDRKGLGSDDSVQKKAVITHFNPNNKAAIAHHREVSERKLTVRKTARHAAKARERKDRIRERNLRRELSGGF